VPVLSGPAEESIAGLPAAPAKLPVAETPTYGEPVSPEQARSLNAPGPAGVIQPGAPGTAANRAGDLPTYGQMEAGRPALPAAGLPHGLKPGDDLPGLAPAGGLLPPPPPAPAKESGLVTAPSAGDGSNLAAFEFLVDLSSSMRRMSHCRGRLKEEAVIQLVRKMNHNIPGHPYQAALRVLGYKQAFTRDDFTTLYYGPGQYSRDGFESAISRLAAADSITPLSDGLKGAEADLLALPSPKTLLMFSDFQESEGSGHPLQDVEKARRRHGPALTLHTFYVTRQVEAERLAKSLAKAGGGQAWGICSLLDNDQAFEHMMLTIFGPGRDDLCYNAPPGATVDERGCWVAAYSQFFDFNMAEVKSEFRPQLVQAARIIQEHIPEDRVVIAGFTDNVGTEEYNLELGRRRAQAVADILVSEGVPAGQLSVISYGKDRPVADNGTNEGRARNRRVEFHVGEGSRAD
jgi:OOP family OmpA-OmpF porin